jgi:hypothetical protein
MASSAFPEPISGIKESLLDATGDILYASADNTPVRLGIGSSAQVLTVASGVPSWATPASGAFVGCLASGVTQTLSSGTETVVAFTNTEYYDTNSFHDTSTNPGRMTIPSGKGGYYLMYGNVPWQTGSPNTRQIRLYKNGSEMRQVYTYGEGTGYYYTQQFMTVVSAAAGDYFEIRATHQNGSSLYIYGESGVGSLPGLTFGCALMGA